MTANRPNNARKFPEREDLAGTDRWKVADRSEALRERAELKESEWKLEAAILCTRRRLEGERRRGAQRRRSRR